MISRSATNELAESCDPDFRPDRRDEDYGEPRVDGNDLSVARLESTGVDGPVDPSDSLRLAEACRLTSRHESSNVPLTKGQTKDLKDKPCTVYKKGCCKASSQISYSHLELTKLNQLALANTEKTKTSDLLESFYLSQ